MDCDGHWTQPLSGSGSMAVFYDMMNDGDRYGICPGLRVDYMIALQMTHFMKLWELLRAELGAKLSTEKF